MASINKTIPKRYPINKHIGEIPEFMFPTGIVEKRHTGIGATQAEIKSTRHSILVFPSRGIAFNKSKSKKNPNTFYVGSLPDKKVVHIEQIRSYDRDLEIEYKKFLVVADSLHKIFEALGEREVYKKYFFMFDEIDKFQDESDFRPELENCLDYFRHKDCRGCLVSATLSEFSDRKLHNLPRIVIEKENPETLDVKLHSIQGQGNILKFLFQKIHQIPNDKILIAHKSIGVIMKLVSRLDKKTRTDIRILCGEGSKEDVGQYFGRLENDLLPGRFNFMTAAYFSGVDIEEDYHLIMISDTSTNFTLLTISEIRQIVGRCRSKLKGIDLIIPAHKEDIPLLTKKELNLNANKLLQSAESFYKSINHIKFDYNSFLKIKKSHITMTIGDVKLIRLDQTQKFRVSSFTIDQYLNRNKQLRLLYGERRSPEKSLSEYFNISTPKSDVKGIDIEREVKKSFLEALPTYNFSDIEYFASNPTEEKILARYKICLQLFDHSDFNWIIDRRYWGKITFRKEYIRRFMINFPQYSGIWKYMKSAFEINKFYSLDEAKTIVEKVLVDITPKIAVKGNDYREILKGFFTLKETTQKKINGFMVVDMSNAHNKFEVNTPERITFEGV